MKTNSQVTKKNFEKERRKTVKQTKRFYKVLIRNDKIYISVWIKNKRGEMLTEGNKKYNSWIKYIAKVKVKIKCTEKL